MHPVRILLASAPHADTFGYSMPPPGLLRLGGELRRNGAEIALEDLAHRLATGELPSGDELAEAAARLLLSRGPHDFIGISTMGATVPIALAIAGQVRAQSNPARVVLGGPGTSGIDKELVERFDVIDAVVRGEGERTLPALLERWSRGGDAAGVPGVTWRDERGEAVREADRSPIDLVDVAPCAWDLLPPLTSYKAVTGEAEGLTPIDSGRGCAYDCSFCNIGRYWGRRSRPLPPALLAAEVLALVEHPGARQAYLCHDLFGAHRATALEFCERLREAGSPVPWECRARLDHVDAELLGAMANAGCYRVLLGVESADPAVRRANGKGMKPDFDPMERIDACVAAGITPILSLILGLPGEDDAALASSLEFCANACLRAGVNLSLHLVNPEPGSALGEQYAGHSKELEGIPPDMAWGAGTTAPERKLIEENPDLFSTWHLLPWEPERLTELHDIATALPPVLMRLGRTFSVLRRLRGEDALALFRAWRRTGQSFEDFARSSDDPLTRDVLEWERAAVRVGTLGGQPRVELSTDRGARATVEVVPARHDLALVTPALLAGSPLPLPDGEHVFALQPTPGPVRGVRTLRLTQAAADLLTGLDGRTPLAQLEHERRGVTSALLRLAEQGLVTAT